MSAVVFKANSYYLRFWQSGSIQYKGKSLKIHAVVILRGTYANQQYELLVYFMKEGNDCPDAIYRPNQKKGYIYLPFKEMSTFMNFLHKDLMINIAFNPSDTSQIELFSDDKIIQ